MIFKNSQDTIEFTDINIPKTVKKIGIKMSGGTDSALVCYMLVKYLKESREDVILHPITSIVVDKPYQKIFAEKQINQISKMLNYKNFGEHFFANASSESAEANIKDQNSLLDSLYVNNIITMHFNGISAIPHKLDAPELYESKKSIGYLVDRSKTKTKKPQKKGNSFSPLINTDKKGIAEHYINLGILEELFPLTRSCTEITTDFSQHCKDCWFCRERYWGFGRYV